MYTAINDIFSQRNNFLIVGLTGRVGSGCSTVADYMSQKKNALNVIEATLGDHPTDNARKRNIIYNYFNENWVPFTVIRVKDIITSFILEYDLSSINEYLKKHKIGLNSIDDWKEKVGRNIEVLSIVNNYKNSDFDKIDFAYKYITDELPSIADDLKNHISEKNYRTYSKIFQAFGDNIRKSGKITSEEQIDSSIYSIAQRINLIIKLIRQYNSKNNIKDYFVIDAIRNPFEALFFRERYSSFYLFAIKCSEDDRQDRLIKGLNLNYKDITDQDDKENPKGSPTKSFEIFVSQNIKTCIEKADIHLINNGNFDNTDHREIKGQIMVV